MKLVVVGNGQEETTRITRLLRQIESSGIRPDLLIYTSGYDQSLDTIGQLNDSDLVLIPAEASVEYIKQIKKLATEAPAIFQEKQNGELRMLNTLGQAVHASEKAMHVSPIKALILDKVESSGDDEKLPSKNHQRMKTNVHHIQTFVQSFRSFDTRQSHLEPSGKPIDHQVTSIEKPAQPRERFLVRISSKLRPVLIDDIAYFYADNRLNFLATWEGQRFVINHSMEDLVRQVSPNEFFRISRSFIISYKSIEMIQVQERNRLKVLLSPGFRSDVFVSRDKVSEFRSWMGE